ncbi:MAG: SGNH/GDSL hydrolase family protein [Hydrococcus sp. Prado102]|jgi:lysophospholipase L1-like esterase|nr:SGNH/GDSL hydrolase family protein [Hydrococcus sp. Prado102]
MLKLPNRRKSYSYYGNSYYGKPKRQPKKLLLWLIISVPVAIASLELLARAYVSIMGKSDEGVLSGLVNAYSLKFLTKNERPVEGVDNLGSLAVERNSSVGYQLIGQKNQFLQINPQGFRDQESLPIVKPKNEIRIFILGGSTAFGQWNQKNEQTIAERLETLLQQRVAQQKRNPDKYRPDIFPFFVPSREKLVGLAPKIREGQYRVINAAVPGYASGNQLAQLALQILPYQPDAIVVLDGYADLMLSSSETQQEVPRVDEFLGDASAHFRASIGQSIEQLSKSSYLINTVHSFVSKSEPNITQKSLVVNPNNKSLAQSLPSDAAELTRRRERYQENQKQLINLSTKAGIPVILALQPEITGRPPEQLSPQEKAIREQLGQDYTQKMPKAYEKFVQANQQLAKTFPNNIKVLNFYQLDKSFPTPTFSDAIHLSDKANAALAQKLYQSITSFEKMQIIPQNYYLKEKNQ